MNGINIRIEQADYIGQVEDVQQVGNMDSGKVFISSNAEELIFCQEDNCLVVTGGSLNTK